MAFQLAPRTSSVCSQSPYSNFLSLSGFAPAVQFCQAFEVNQKVPSISSCPSSNTLCKVLSSLSSCELDVIEQGCICIGVTPTTTVSVPKTTSSSVKSSATTSPKTTNSWTAVQSSSSTWATSAKTTNTWAAAQSSSSNTCSVSTVTVTATPTICLPPIVPSTTSSAPQSTPTCQDGAEAVSPPPDGAVCQQNGTLNPTNWDLISGPTADSTSGCAALCLGSDDCQVSEYDYETQNCQLFTGGDAEDLGFVPVAASPFIVSDVECFVAC